ncbi:MAG: hypothetical protein ACE5FI_17985 [Anaerolineales bacterium]
MSIALGLAAALLGAAPGGKTLACTQPPGGNPVYTPAERTRAAEVVLLGEIVAVRDGSDGAPGEVADVRVEQYLKGAGGPAQLVIDGFGSTAFCRSPVQAGQRWIIFANGDPGTGALAVNYLGQFSGVLSPESGTVAEVLAAAGPATAGGVSTADDFVTPLPDTPTPVPASTAFDTPQLHRQAAFQAALPYLGAGCASLLAVLGGLWLVLRTHRK